MIKQHIFYNTGIEHLLNVFRHISDSCLIMTSLFAAAVCDCHMVMQIGLKMSLLHHNFTKSHLDNSYLFLQIT